jgi:ABC-type phosphate transport system substrate-binding protein
MRRCKYMIVLSLVLTMSKSIAFAETSTRPFVIIVNPKNEVTTVDDKFLLEIFMKKTTRWSNKDIIQPVDLERDSFVRRKFSEGVLKKTVPEVKNFWQQRIFSGFDVPPPELPKDNDIIQYVLNHPGAIGYVSNDADTSNVKVLIVK